jgi:hypothetical protein
VSATFLDQAYALPGALLAPLNWMDVATTSSAIEYFPTIQPVDASDGEADVTFVPASSLDLIGVALNVPVDVDRNLAHAIVRFTNTAGGGLVGISVTPPVNASLAYDTGSGLFRDDVDATAERGLVALLNMDAAAFPGAISRLEYTGAKTGATSLKLGRGAVTVVTIKP